MTSRRSWSPATRRRRSRSGRSGVATTCRSSGVIRPGASAAALASRNRRVGVIATPATIRSHAYFTAIKDENPAVEVYEHATPALVPLVEAGTAVRSGRRDGRRGVARAAARRARRRRRVHLPEARRRLDRHAAARLHALPAAAVGDRGARSASGSRSSTRRPPRRPRWPSCSASTASRRRARRAERRPTRAPPATTGPPGGAGRPSIVQLTTGDPDQFHALAGRLFGSDFPGRRAGRARGRSAMSRRRLPSRATANRRPVVARRPRLAGRLPDRLGTRRRGDGGRAPRRARGASRAGRLAGGRAHRRRTAGRRPGLTRRGRAAGGRAALCRGDGAHRPGAHERAGHAAAGRRRALGRGRSSRLGPRQHRLVRIADRQARGRPARPGDPAGWRAGQGRDGPGQSLGDESSARVPARVHGHPGARPVRPGPAVHGGDARPAAVRRGERSRDGPGAGRADRPVPDLDRPARDDPRLRVRGAPLASAVSRGASRAPAHAVRQRRPRPRPRGGPGHRPGAPWREQRASTGWSG